VWSPPAVIAVAPLSPATPTARGLHHPPPLQTAGPLLVPIPSSPAKLYPQHSTAPAATIAHVWLLPAAIAKAPLSPATVTACGEQATPPQRRGPLLDPLPSWP
jgi:hypothetical protein